MKKGAFKIQTGKITLTNGRIYTPDGLVNNLVFGHGRIIAAGGNEIIDRDSKKIDLHGRTVLPGFCDCNLNFIEWACANEIINLSACGNFNDVKVNIKAFAKNNTKPLRGWIIAKNLPDGININAEDLDKLSPDFPCIVFKNNIAVLNTMAMLQTDDANKNLLDHDEAEKLIPPLNSEDIIYLIKNYAHRIPAAGLSEIWLSCENYPPDIFFNDACDLFPFRVRCNFNIKNTDELDELLLSGLRTSDGLSMCKAGAVIIDPDVDPIEQKNIINMAHFSGMQVISDSDQTCLKVIDKANRQHKIKTRDLILNPDEKFLYRMKLTGMGGIISSLHENNNILENNNMLSAFQNGVILCAGSDSNQVIRPLKNIADFVNNGLTMAQAVNLYTWAAAWNGWNEKRRGEIAAGYDADLVILERDPFLIKLNEVSTIDITMTFCAGEVIYDSGALI